MKAMLIQEQIKMRTEQRGNMITATTNAEKEQSYIQVTQLL